MGQEIGGTGSIPAQPQPGASGLGGTTPASLQTDPAFAQHLPAYVPEKSSFSKPPPSPTGPFSSQVHSVANREGNDVTFDLSGTEKLPRSSVTATFRTPEDNFNFDPGTARRLDLRGADLQGNATFNFRDTLNPATDDSVGSLNVRIGKPGGVNVVAGGTVDPQNATADSVNATVYEPLGKHTSVFVRGALANPGGDKTPKGTPGTTGTTIQAGIGLGQGYAHYGPNILAKDGEVSVYETRQDTPGKFPKQATTVGGSVILPAINAGPVTGNVNLGASETETTQKGKTTGTGAVTAGFDLAVNLNKQGNAKLFLEAASSFPVDGTAPNYTVFAGGQIKF